MESGFILSLTCINADFSPDSTLVAETETTGILVCVGPFGLMILPLMADVAGLRGYTLKVIRHPDFLTEILFISL